MLGDRQEGVLCQGNAHCGQPRIHHRAGTGYQEVGHMGPQVSKLDKLDDLFQRSDPVGITCSLVAAQAGQGAGKSVWVKELVAQDFSGGPMAKTSNSQCRRPSSIPGQGSKSHMPQLAACMPQQRPEAGHPWWLSGNRICLPLQGTWV